MKNECFNKATAYEVALQDLAVLEYKLLTETMVRKRPDKEFIKAVLKNASETLRSEDVKPLDLEGYANDFDNLVEGIDKRDLPIRGDTLELHFQDISNRLWEEAWDQIIACECGKK
jgi:hypothetical protein